MDEEIKLLLNKSYVVCDYRDNTVIAFTNTEEEADSISSIDDNYVVYNIANEIICFDK